MSDTDDLDVEVLPIPLSLLKSADQSDTAIQQYIRLHYPDYEHSPSPEHPSGDDSKSNVDRSESSDEDNSSNDSEMHLKKPLPLSLLPHMLLPRHPRLPEKHTQSTKTIMRGLF